MIWTKCTRVQLSVLTRRRSDGRESDRLRYLLPAGLSLLSRNLRLHAGQHRIKRGTIVAFTAQDDAPDRPGSGNVGQRVAIKQDEVGRLARRDAAIAVQLAEPCRAGACRRRRTLRDDRERDR